MDDIMLSSEPEATAEDIETVRNGLRAFNHLVDPNPVTHPVKLFLRDANHVIQGGLLGAIWNGWLYIDFLWVTEGLRKHGYGSQLLLAAEEEANRQQCFAAVLETFSFQARPFYERFGYEVFAELPDCPWPDATRYFMRKTLVGPQPALKPAQRTEA